MSIVTSRPFKLAIVCVALVGATFALLFSASTPAGDVVPAGSKPKALWDPASLNETIQPGQTRTIPVTLTAEKNLPDTLVHVSPEIAPYVAVSPTTIGKTRKGTSLPLTLTVSIPIDALPATTTGMIELQKVKQQDTRDEHEDADDDSDSDLNGKEKHKTLTKPLPITLNVRTFLDSQLGVSFNLPGSYLRVDPIAPKPSLGSGLGYTLTTYERTVGSQTPESDEAPLLGCAINVGVEDNSAHLSLSEWVSARSYHRPGDVDEASEIAGVFAVRRSGIGDIYGDPFVTVFVSRGDIVVTLSLEAHGDTVIQEQCHADFDQFLASFSLME